MLLVNFYLQLPASGLVEKLRAQSQHFLADEPAGCNTITAFFSPTQSPPPVLSDSLLSAEGHFKIYYTTVGRDSVPATDADSNSFPDRIEAIAAAFEKSYRVEIEDFNYQLPPSMQNGSAPYHVYVVELNNNFALTVPVAVDSFAWEQKTVSSYILFDNDFKGQGFHIQGENAIKVIAAHEFFHAIQLGYVFRKKDAFFFELSAVWMEDQVFDEIDNYLYYLDYFFQAPEIPLNGVSYRIPNVLKHIYGDCIFAFFLAENYGPTIIRDVWRLMPNQTALSALNQLFTQKNTSFEKQFLKFAKWNFFTGARALPEFSYDQGEKFPLIKMETDTAVTSFLEKNDAGYFLSSKYYTYQPVTDGIYSIQFYAENTSHWRLGVLIWEDELLRHYSVLPRETLAIDTVTCHQKITVIACNVDRFADPEKIYFKEEPETYYFILNKKPTPVPGSIKSYAITAAYPNPFSERIRFSIKKIIPGTLDIKIYNIRGQLIENFYFGPLTNNLNYFDWPVSSDSFGLTSGLYFFKFSDGYFSEVKKVFLNH